MRRPTIALLWITLCSLPSAQGAASPEQPDKSWIERSNAYTSKLLDVELEHRPERGSREGLAKFDTRISVPTLADEMARRHELEKVLVEIDAARSGESDQRVREDLEILHKALDLQFRQEDYRLQHEVPFDDASAEVFQGLRVLLDDQVAPERRQAAVTRLRKYAGLEGGYQPITEVLRQRELEQIAKPGVLYPSKGEVETELGRNPNYVNGISELFTRYGLKGWEDAYAQLKKQLTDYDAWVRENILARARTDFRLPREKYALAFEEYGIDLPPERIAAMAHAAFGEYQKEMAPLAARIARANGYPSSDYRAVIRELKKKQITGDAILPFFNNRLHEIEKIIAAHNLSRCPAAPPSSVWLPRPRPHNNPRRT